MVKRQKEKLYQSSREHKANAALRASGSAASGASSASASAAARRLLPFSHCALTLTAYQTPVCNSQGIVFENSAILPFLLQHGIDPCTGKPMTSRDLITLRMDQNEQGQWQCPILHKPFANHTKIVAIVLENNDNDNNNKNEPKHANVYSYQAYHELNVKANHYEDFLSGQAFDKKKNVLILYDPNDDDLNQRRDINTFYHIQNARKLLKSDSSQTQTVQHGMTATRIMEQLAKNKKQQQQAEDSKKRARSDKAAKRGEDAKDTNESSSSTSKRIKRDTEILARDVTGVRYTTTGGAASFTSTGVDVRLDNCDRPATEEEILQAQLLVMKGKSKLLSKKMQHKKGLVRIVTSLGEVTVELHCDIAPRTCYNFLGLCRSGSYNGSKFHRLIPKFMIQGGKSDATKSSTATEDESLWGNRPFVDEFDDRLKHDGPGILSMANSGPNTNRRQFFFTFKACPHLDRKHAVFGHIIDGMNVLQEMEKVPTNTDAKHANRPLTKISILSTIILVDPAKEAQELEEKRLDEIIAARKRQAEKQTTVGAKSKIASSTEKDDNDISTTATTTVTSKNDGVGHFLREKLKQRAAAAAAKNGSGKKKQTKDDIHSDPVLPSRRPPPPKKTNFGDFSGW